MIRRDYILRMIEEFARVLAELQSAKQGQLWREAALTLEDQFQRLVGMNADQASQLSEIELRARLIRAEPSGAINEKTSMLITLFKEAGDVANAQDRRAEGRACYLRGLHLLLETQAGEEPAGVAGFAPQLEPLVAALSDAPLPLHTELLLMRHYERTGQFARAEDVLFVILDREPANERLQDFGTAFYHRLEGKSDAALAAGDLPRPEIVAGLAEVEKRRGIPGS